MHGWQTSYLGLREMPGEISEFELQTFFSFSRAELELIARRRSDNLKLGLALHIGFARMTGRPLNSVRSLPSALLRHLGRELDIAAPDLVSLRAPHALGRRRATTGPGLPGRAGIHAAPPDRRNLGPNRSGLIGHDEPGDESARVAGPPRPAAPDGFHRRL